VNDLSDVAAPSGSTTCGCTVKLLHQWEPDIEFLKSAAFGALFAVTFTVAAAFQVAMALLGLVLAFTSPAIFKMNGAPATNAGEAIGVVIFLLVVAIVLNAAISAIGSGIWLAVRPLLPVRSRQPRAE
jgi:hypothetical protein